MEKIMKKKGKGTSDQSVFRSRIKFGKIPLLVMSYKAVFKLFQELHHLI